MRRPDKIPWLKFHTRYQTGSVRVRGGKWIGEWRGEPDETGKRPRLSRVLGPKSAFHSKTQARDYLRRTWINRPQVPAGNITLRTYIEEVYLPHMARRWAISTYSAVRSVLAVQVIPALGARDLKAITRRDAETFLFNLRDAGHATGYVKRIRDALSQVFEAAMDEEPEPLIGRNPLRHLGVPLDMRPPKETRALSEQEAGQVYAIPGRVGLIFRILLVCGLRNGELAGLKREDVLPGGLVVNESRTRGRRLKCPKNRRTRVQPLPPALEAELKNWLAREVAPAAGAPVFSGADDGTMSYHATDRLMGEARELSGIPDLTMKMCRTTFGTLLEGDAKDIEDLMGHRGRTVTTKHYRRAIPERQFEAVADLERRLFEGSPVPGTPVHLVQATLGHASVATTGMHLSGMQPPAWDCSRPAGRGKEASGGFRSLRSGPGYPKPLPRARRTLLPGQARDGAPGPEFRRHALEDGAQSPYSASP